MTTTPSPFPVTSVLPAIVRTVVPFVIATLLSLPLTRHVLELLDVTDGDARTALAKALPVVIGAVYYVVVRWLERNVDPRFGVLLGSTAQPTYSAPVAELKAAELVPPPLVVSGGYVAEDQDELLTVPDTSTHDHDSDPPDAPSFVVVQTAPTAGATGVYGPFPTQAAGLEWKRQVEASAPPYERPDLRVVELTRRDLPADVQP